MASTSKRLMSGSEDSTASLHHDDYTAGWISALPLEMTAAQAILDQVHEPLPQSPQDSNCYTLGSIGEHNVAMACLPKGQYGTNNAATVANSKTRSFLRIQHRLIVGIGGGVPNAADIRLGDVVVSTDVVQYDLVKVLPNNAFQRIAYPMRPPHSFLTAASRLRASHSSGQNHISATIIESRTRLAHYDHPMLQNRLFCSNYNHPSTAESCDDCDQSQLVSRHIRQTADPMVHYGRIAPGN
ncbi:hypothetical protein F53441_7593 [Fusarium austroafricanum]|uniref:Nucleoside phosphorylase domain-containing protein n=1 Tax=Fusarium austroafricanum TaxID=2364996 RepID=A0A8H4KFY2_9HYPO|nr:hypothetical protein F53441_7593 [Fusarium austroafricanum]